MIIPNISRQPLLWYQPYAPAWVGTLTVSGAPTSCNIVLTVNGQTAATIAYTSSTTAATVAAALNALNVVNGAAQVSGSNGGPYTISLQIPSAQVSVTGNTFVGGTSPAVSVSAFSPGFAVGCYSDLGVTPCADTNTVEQINDLTGNGYHLTQTTSGNRGEYRASAFTGGFPCLALGSSSSPNTATSYTIANPPPAGVQNGGCTRFYLFSASYFGTANGLFSIGTGGNGEIVCDLIGNSGMPGSLMQYLHQTASGIGFSSTFPNGISTNYPYLVAVRTTPLGISNSGGNQIFLEEVFIDGALTTRRTSTDNANITSPTWILGLVNTYKFNGLLASMSFFDSPLSDADMAGAGEYIAKTFNHAIQGSRTTATPIAVLAQDGNSIGMGAYAGNGYEVQAETFFITYPTANINFSYSGSTTPAQNTYWPWNAQKFFPPGLPVLPALMEIVNDASLTAGATASTCTANVIQWCYNALGTPNVPAAMVFSAVNRYFAAQWTSIVTINGSPTSGTFTLTVNAQTTGTIAYNASTSTVASALTALSGVGAGNAVVTGFTGGPYTVVLKLASQPTFVLGTNSLNNGATVTVGASVSLETTRLAINANLRSGSNAAYVGTMTFTGLPTSGTYTISVTIGGVTQTTASINWNANAATIATAINAISNVNGIVAVGGPAVLGPIVQPANSVGPFTLSFVTGSQPTLAVGTNSLGGGTSPNISFSTFAVGSVLPGNIYLIDIGNAVSCQPVPGGTTYSTALIGATGAYSNTTYYVNAGGNNIHLTNAGHALIARPYADMANYLIAKYVNSAQVAGGGNF